MTLWQLFSNALSGAGNSLLGIIEGFRRSLIGGPPPGGTLVISSIAIVVLLVSGMFFLRRMEKTFSDLV